MGQLVQARAGTTVAAVKVDTAPSQYLTFALGSEMFAVGILNVKEIIEYGNLTEIPMMPTFIRGVINLRGSVVPVIDLAARFGGKSAELNRRTCIVIVEVSDQIGEQVSSHDIGITLFSALKRQGVGDAAEILQHWALGAMVLPDFTPPPAEPDDEPAAGPA